MFRKHQYLLASLAILSSTAMVSAQPQRGQRAVPPGQQAPAAVADRDPPGEAGTLPETMDRIAQATDIEYKPKPAGARVKFNLQDADLAELVKHISGITGRRFIYGAKVRKVKATVVSPEPVTVAEAYEAFLSILEVNGMTVVPHGRFLKIVDTGGIVSQDTPIYSRGAVIPNTARYITRMYRLESVSPEDAAQLLAKYKSKEGDISVYAPGRLLIITDTGSQIQRMIRILEEVDTGGDAEDARMWIQPVNYGTAEDMATRISELFDVGAAGQPGGPAGLNKIVADPLTNSLIVVGDEESYMRVLDLMKRLDVKPGDSGKIRVLPLQHAVSQELANVLNQMLSGAGGRQAGGNQPAQGVAAIFEGEIRVTPDPATNSLVVTSSARDYASLRLVIEQLDQPRRQVFIEAVIMDLAVSDSTQLGLAFHGGGTADLGGPSESLILGGFDAGRSIGFPTDASALQGLAAGVRGPALANTEQFTPLGLSIPAFGVALNALASSGKSNILATPHIIATDNVQAEINIGENIPLQTNVGGSPNLGALAGLAGGQQGGGLGNIAALGALGGFGTAPRQDVGNRIRVTPHINESNQVRLEIEQESSAPGAASGDLGAVSITQRTARTTLVVQDQQTVVIGGLMRDEYVTSRTKIPILGDLPVLGFLFRRTTTDKRKANLLLILTPYVIRSQEDLRKIFERKMRERQEFLDRYFVFSGDEWEPPKDYERTNGLVEAIRQSYFEIAEQLRLERESQPLEQLEHQPVEPIELPDMVSAGNAGPGTPAKKPAPKRRRRNRRKRQGPFRPKLVLNLRRRKERLH